jgi:hypothetical protein
MISALHILSTFFLTGLIWTIQWLHYPGFKFSDLEQWGEYHRFHSSRITMIVFPMMFLELMTGFMLLIDKQNTIMGINLLTILLIWASTIFISVPIHTLLANQFSLDEIQNLVLTNWIRTFLWTIRSFVWFYFLIITLEYSNK